MPGGVSRGRPESLSTSRRNRIPTHLVLLHREPAGTRTAIPAVGVTRPYDGRPTPDGANLIGAVQGLGHVPSKHAWALCWTGAPMRNIALQPFGSGLSLETEPGLLMRANHSRPSFTR